MQLSKKAIILAALLVAAGCYGFMGAGVAAVGAQKSGRRPAAQAKNLFKQSCAKCHGMNGDGRTVKGEVLGAPDFTDASWQGGVSDQRMSTSIMHGRSGMPSFKDKLSPAEVSALVAYVRTFRN